MKRIEQIDALRGFALFGIIMTHMFEGYLASFPVPQYYEFNIMNSTDRISQFIIQNLFIGKFFSIFSMLFGLSFYMILDQKKDEKSLQFIWRLILLFLIGFVHHIHYRGDILTIYAVCGLALIPFRKVSTKTVLILGLFLSLNGPSTAIKTVELIRNQFIERATIDIEKEQRQNSVIFDDLLAKAVTYYEMILNGEYKNLIVSNSTYGFKIKFLFLKFSSRIWVIPGLFLLGLWVGRKKIHENIHKIPLAKFTFLSGVLSVTLWILNHHYASVYNSEFGSYVFSIIRDIINFSVPLFYIGIVLLLFDWKATKNIILQLVPVGKMGLTTYVSQSAFGILIFYGYGLGLLLKLSGTFALGLGLLFFVFQILISRWWLIKFRYGPLEWLWRSLTYGKKQPFKIKN